MTFSLFCPAGFPKHNYEYYLSARAQIPRAGLYESHYVKANSPDGQSAFWLKHNILIWRDSNRPAVVELWGIWFERGKAPIALKQEVPLTDVKLATDTLQLHGPSIALETTGSQTQIQSGDRLMSWSLEFTPTAPPLILLPHAWMYEYRLPKKKILTPVPRMLVHGQLNVLGKIIQIDGWQGFRGHNWGTEHAYTYAYGNCTVFKEIPELMIDGFSAKLKLGPVITPFICASVLRHQVQDEPMNGLLTALSAQESVKFPQWQVTWKEGNRTLTLHQSAKKEDFVGLVYQHPSGQVSYCYNTKFAHTLVDFDSSEHHVHAESDVGELEFLFNEPIKGIELIGEK